MAEDLQTLLLLEDADADAALVGVALAELGGWAVRRARTLAEGLRVLAEHQPAATLIDLGLPDADGLEAVGDVTAVATGPVLVLTGRSEARWGPEAIRRGAEDFLSKDELRAEILGRALAYAVERVERRQAMARIHRRLARYTDALANDIAGPLTTIRGFAELIRIEQQQGGAPTRSQLYADQIVQQTRALAVLAEDLLDESGRTSAGEQEVAVSGTVAFATTILSDRIKARMAALVVDDLPVVRAGAPALRQALLQLLGNAVRHADADRLTVRVGARPAPDGGVSLTVDDNGETISDAWLDARSGRGLARVGGDSGLDRVAEILRRLDGHLALSRSPLGGLRATMVLPPERVVRHATGSATPRPQH